MASNENIDIKDIGCLFNDNPKSGIGHLDCDNAITKKSVPEDSDQALNRLRARIAIAEREIEQGMGMDYSEFSRAIEEKYGIN